MAISIPKYRGSIFGTHCAVQEGKKVTFIWIFTDKGAESIATLYANCEDIQEQLRCSRATAYRIMAREPKRYWCSDCREAERPLCFSVMPREHLKNIKILPVGNPNFRNGIYQQSLARRVRKKIR